MENANIAAYRQIVAEKQCAKVQGVLVDLFSACAIVQVYDRLSGDVQAKYAALAPKAQARLAMEMVK